MHTLVAYYESIDPGGALSNLTAVPDQHVATSGDDITVPSEVPNIIGEIGLTAAAGLARAQVSSPALRAIALIDVEPIVGAVVFGAPPEAIMHPISPVPLEGSESLNFLMESDPASGEAHYGLIWLSDGQQVPISGQIYTVQATAAITLAAGLWVSGNLVFAQDLPVGRYQIVGMRARGAALVAARLIFIGGVWRPGVPAVNAIGDNDPQIFRHGRLGVWGEFDHSQPPLLECLGVTDTAQTVHLDLIKLG